MSSSQFREPTNDELWAQPPAGSGSGPQGLAPIPQVPVPAPTPPVPAATDRTVFALAIVSMSLGIPLTAISLSMAGLPGLVLVWVGIVLVNLIYSRSRRS